MIGRAAWMVLWAGFLSHKRFGSMPRLVAYTSLSTVLGGDEAAKSSSNKFVEAPEGWG